jgi:hypothetical protein
MHKKNSLFTKSLFYKNVKHTVHEEEDYEDHTTTTTTTTSQPQQGTATVFDISLSNPHKDGSIAYSLLDAKRQQPIQLRTTPGQTKHGISGYALSR